MAISLGFHPSWIPGSGVLMFPRDIELKVLGDRIAGAGFKIDDACGDE
jgi:hypothetical protein